jgi:hypothetical protein
MQRRSISFVGAIADVVLNRHTEERVGQSTTRVPHGQADRLFPRSFSLSRSSFPSHRSVLFFFLLFLGVFCYESSVRLILFLRVSAPTTHGHQGGFLSVG